MNKRWRRHMPFLMAALAIAIAAIPLGNAIKDYGIIHTLGLISGLIVVADLYWLRFGKG